MLKALIKTLEDLVAGHLQLLDMSRRKKEILIKGEVDDLTQVVQQEAQLVKELANLEEDRMLQVKAYMQSRAINSEHIDIAQLLAGIPDQGHQEQVEKLTVTLQQTIEELQQYQQLNGTLLQDSLHFVNQSIQLMTDQGTEQINYQRPSADSNHSNHSTSSPGRFFFDTKA